MVPALTFDPINHVYTLDGVVVPSVTGILRASGVIDFSGIPDATLEAAQRRGTVVHQAVHYYNESDLDLESFRRDYPDWVGYVDSWIAFRAARQFTPILNEHRVASRVRKVAGTIDCLGVLDGSGALIDFATGRPQDVSKDLQTAAYHLLLLEWGHDDERLADFLLKHPVVRRYGVRLMRDGSVARIEQYRDPLDVRKFVTLVEAQRIVAERRGELAA